jgi:hypothetical protein
VNGRELAIRHIRRSADPPKVLSAFIARLPRQGLACQMPFSRDLVAWHRNAQPLFLFRRLRDLEEAVERAWPLDGIPGEHRSWELADEALARLAQHHESMRQAGVSSIPELPDEWRERIAKQAVDHARH